MEKLLAVCGLDCAQCDALIAYNTNSQELREKTAVAWSQAHGFPFTAQMINCQGCLSTEGVQIAHCAQCEIRLCGLKHGVQNCFECADFSTCPTISNFLDAVPSAKENLEALAK